MIIEIRNSYSFSQLGKRQYQEDSRIPNVDVIINKQKFFAVCNTPVEVFLQGLFSVFLYKRRP